jgi:hypothetical protein
MKPFYFFLVLVAIGIVVKMFCKPTGAPFADRKVEFVSDGMWYAPATSCQKNEKGEMVLVWHDSYYRYTSNTVTGVETKESKQK